MAALAYACLAEDRRRCPVCTVLLVSAAAAAGSHNQPARFAGVLAKYAVEAGSRKCPVGTAHFANQVRPVGPSVDRILVDEARAVARHRLAQTAAQCAHEMDHLYRAKVLVG